MDQLICGTTSTKVSLGQKEWALPVPFLKYWHLVRPWRHSFSLASPGPLIWRAPILMAFWKTRKTWFPMNWVKMGVSLAREYCISGIYVVCMMVVISTTASRFMKKSFIVFYCLSLFAYWDKVSPVVLTINRTNSIFPQRVKVYYIFCFKGDKKEENSDTEDNSTENDSDENEERTLGDTTDVLNMVMYLLVNGWRGLQENLEIHKIGKCIIWIVTEPLCARFSF